MKALVLAAVLVAACPAAAGTLRLELDSRVVWQAGATGFGGFSGVAVWDDGTRLAAVSDRGHWATGDIVRSDGHMTGVRLTGFGPLLAISGEPLSGEDVDAEGFAVDREGRSFVSFEAFHRIRRYDQLDGPAAAVPSPPAFSRLQNNSGIEALAVDGAGALYAVPERSGQLERPFPVFRFSDGEWDRGLSIPREGPFLVVDADFGPDGAFYLLERDFEWLGGFATRIRRFTLGAAGFGNETTLLETPLGSLDNMEGISVWRHPDGSIRLTLIADDNFFALQDTAVAEYVLVRD